MDILISLLPLALASAIVPVQIVITVLLLRTDGGTATAAAWAGGMAAVRLIQGVVFGILVGPAVTGGEGDDGPGTVVSVLLLVMAFLLYIGAARQLLSQPDEDAPPPRWMAMFEHVRPAKAFGMGALLMLVGAKFWAFTLGAIAVIGDADVGQTAAVAWFLVFVVLAGSVHLVLLGIAVLAPARSAVVLDRVNGLLQRYSRQMLMVVGVVFGTWFLAKALDGLGVW